MVKYEVWRDLTKCNKRRTLDTQRVLYSLELNEAYANCLGRELTLFKRWGECGCFYFVKEAEE